MKPDNTKSELHLRNKHRARYDFNQLTQAGSALEKYVKLNEYGDVSIDFSNPQAVKALNQALLKHFYALNCIFARRFLGVRITCIIWQIFWVRLMRV